MSDSPFERDLAAMFADVPKAPDADAFVLAVDQRLDRHLRQRRWILGAFTAAGTMVAGLVFVESGGLARFGDLSRDIAASAALASNPIALGVAGLLAVAAGLLIARPSVLEG